MRNHLNTLQSSYPAADIATSCSHGLETVFVPRPDTGKALAWRCHR